MACGHCGSPIVGAVILIPVDNGIRELEFHSKPEECYIKEVRRPHYFKTFIQQEILLTGGTEN